ncbi:MAG TPA: FHA domain-containing protein [Planctomycetaceae bacterium]|jgi:pSer/pThr/pTyr-binding forkhead associated (FHA) protein|nr:FHA domain-containing protein [Planctomycetaceae bacterium]
MRAQLIPVKGGQPIVIQRDVTVVGRQKDQCDVVLDRSSISKLHCLIVRTDGLLFIRDLGSTNGTKVNGQRVIRGALLPGDELAFASEKFRVEMGPDLPPEPEDIHGAQTEEIRLPTGGLLAGLQEDIDSDQSDSDVRLLDDD